MRLRLQRSRRCRRTKRKYAHVAKGDGPVVTLQTQRAARLFGQADAGRTKQLHVLLHALAVVADPFEADILGLND